MAAATITSPVPGYTIGDTKPLTFSNPSNRYLQIVLISTIFSPGDNPRTIKTLNLGQVTSTTITFTSGEIADLYNDILYELQRRELLVSLRSFSDPSYSTQDGSNQDYFFTLRRDTATNRPTFTDYSVASVNNTFTVIDKYGNTLVSTDNTTLQDGLNKMIAGYSTVRATILEANRGTGQNSAVVKGMRLTATRKLAGIISSQSVSQDYLDITPPGDDTPSNPDITLDMANAYINSFSVVSYDWGNLASLPVVKTLDLIAEYTDLTLSSLTLTRDNFVDTETTLAFTGEFWKKYFSSNTTSNPGGGVLNTVTCQYRWKSTTHDWEELDGTFTITIATPGVVTKTDHGFETGDQVWFTTTGALPTGLSVNTVYYVIYVNSSTFRLATSLANANAGTAINTTGSQSGVHTLYGDSMWTTITPSTTDGDIVFDDYIDGDLGLDGFDSEKSFTIEVRAYDKLTVVIVEAILSVGTPLLDLTQNGIAIKKKYDQSEGGFLQIYGQDIMKMFALDGAIYPGKIVVSVASNALTVALKHISGNNPSEEQPVWVKINDVVYKITAALSVTAAVATGSLGLSSVWKESVPHWLWTYLAVRSGEVVIGYSRIPYAKIYSEFVASTTDDKGSYWSTTPNSTDPVATIGMFDAQITFTDGYWSLPSGNTVITKPGILVSTWKDFVLANHTGWSGTPTSLLKYRVVNDSFEIEVYVSGTSNNSTTQILLPFPAARYQSMSSYAFSGALDRMGVCGIQPAGAVLDFSTLVTSGSNLVFGAHSNSGTKAVYAAMRIGLR